MKTHHPVLQATITGLLTALTAGGDYTVPDNQKPGKVRGHRQAGMHDCGALDGSHQCAGQAKAGSAGHEWV